MKPLQRYGCFYLEIERPIDRVRKIISRLSRDKSISVAEAKTIAEKICDALGVRANWNVLNNLYPACNGKWRIRYGYELTREWLNANAPFSQVDFCQMCGKLKPDVKEAWRVSRNAWEWNADSWTVFRGGECVSANFKNTKPKSKLCGCCVKKAEKIVKRNNDIAANKYLINQINKELKNGNQDNRRIA